MESADVKIASNSSQASLMSSRGVTINANSPKMGSRRIFTPQFKLQVLESYRNDSDCKGNQRATARKYNIHRRQIQKWLQCESSLRSSVANINHSSVKHQFHNVSLLHQQQPQTQIQRNTVTTNCSITNSFPSSQRNSVHFCADTIRPEMPLSSVKVPLSSTENSTSTIQSSHDILKSSNLVTVIAASAVNSTNSTCYSTTSSAVATPLRPSPIISGCRETTASISPVFHSHHHTFGVPTFNLSHSHHHIGSQVQQQHEQPSYQYHKLVYSPTLTQIQTEKQQPSYFTPAALSTAINVISSTTSTTNSFTTAIVEHIDSSNTTQSKKYTSFFPDTHNDLTGDPNRIFNLSNTQLRFVKNDVPFSTAFPYGPMDLSIHHRREVKSQSNTNIYNQNSAIIDQPAESIEKVCDDKLDVVDLTYRKRKIFTNASDEYKDISPEKLPKLTNIDPNSNEDEDVEIEVGVEEKFLPAKPVKLFKPYLLDNCENNDNNNSTSSSSSKNLINKHNELTEKNLTKTLNSSFILRNESTFPVALKGSKTESLNFLLDSRSESPRGALSPATTLATLSPKCFQCPKGSPASSGYESSTSSYSDSSLSSRCENYAYGQTCSINMRLQSIYGETSYQSKHVQSWLDKDDTELLATSSSIALLA